MSTPQILASIICLVLLAVLMCLNMPIGFAMLISGFLGIAYLRGFEPALAILQEVPFSSASSYVMAVIPLFMWMGELASCTGMSENLYNAADKWVGRLRGGLAMATCIACAAFSAISGSSIATAATIGSVAIPEMKKYKYAPELITGSVGAGGTLGNLIPPSIGFIVYGLITEQSVGKLLLAGLLPGILLTVMFMLTIAVLCWINPNLAPLGPKSSLKEKLVSIKSTWTTLFLFLIVIGGIYIGVFTPTEAAGIGTLGVFLVALVGRKLSWNNLIKSLVSAAVATAMIFILYIGAMVLNYFFVLSEIPAATGTFVAQMGLSKYIILAGIVFLYIVLGTALDSLAVMVLTLPIFFPIVIGLGFDPIWYGVVMIIMNELGLISPPVGLTVFVIAGIAKDVPVNTIYRGLIPFAITILICLVIITVFPQIVLYLPSLMK